MRAENVRMGNRITVIREGRQWNKARLAREAGVAPSYITRIEQGKFDRPSVDIVQSIASALGVAVADLTDPPPPPAKVSEDALRAMLMAMGFRAHETHVVNQILADMVRPGRTDRQREQILHAVATILAARDHPDETV